MTKTMLGAAMAAFLSAVGAANAATVAFDNTNTADGGFSPALVASQPRAALVFGALATGAVDFVQADFSGFVAPGGGEFRFALHEDMGGALGALLDQSDLAAVGTSAGDFVTLNVGGWDAADLVAGDTYWLVAERVAGEVLWRGRDGGGPAQSFVISATDQFSPINSDLDARITVSPVPLPLSGALLLSGLGVLLLRRRRG